MDHKILDSCDEVDFVRVTHNNNNEYEELSSTQVAGFTDSNTKATTSATTTSAAGAAAAIGEPNGNNTLKKSKERRTLFNFGSNKKYQQQQQQQHQQVDVAATSDTFEAPPAPAVPIGTPPRQHKFVKSHSLARLLGNTYNAKKFEKEEQKRKANEVGNGSGNGKFNTFSGRRGRAGPYLERFTRVSKEDGDIAYDDSKVTNMMTLTTDSRDLLYGSRQEHRGEQECQTPQEPNVPHHHQRQQDHQHNLSSRTMKTLTRSLGKLWWKRTHSVEISTPDPEFKVSYLGNVLTGWAKAGEGCVEKQLNTLWRNYTQHSKPDVIMRVKVCASGLKATTRQHGLTEYWSNRITYCCAPKNYPRVFCWIYRHEGRKLKHELRCHAVLCSKEKIAQDICETLKENLESALREFKREKILKQNARLSLANAVYDNPSLPRRKIMLSVGGNNYRPPLERSKSAPKLMAIEEAIGEEEGDEIEDTNEPEMMPCCQKDSLYPAMTLGRRRCRRGHSIRRTGKIKMAASCCSTHDQEPNVPMETKQENKARDIQSNDGSDSDDFEKLLKFDTTLSNELLPYFDMQLHKSSSRSMTSLSEYQDGEAQEVGDKDVLEEEPLSLLPIINSDPSADPEADYQTKSAPRMVNDGDEDVEIVGVEEEDYMDDADDHYFRQAAMLTMLHRSSMRKIRASHETASLQFRHQAQSSISSNASSSTTASSTAARASSTTSSQHGLLQSPDSDEGSISSGCETASTVTNVNPEHEQEQVLEQMMMYQRLEPQLRLSDISTTYSSSSSITLKMSEEDAPNQTDDGSDSDESGYVEFQEKDKVNAVGASTNDRPARVKPQLPPKPAPRRSISHVAVGAAESML
ncbi:uncharacterized protein Dwil_GK11221 [Drosophila willistoni]|uniref:PID domain-containing protein n=2 Tax=Drosophila willistoni TaxID=7260 RepID=B4NB97_DROWI|nr:uncharacterized protein Dwil_GK11221 [Drosophila willistoni]